MAGERLSRPLLVALAGLPGAGKTELARRLAPVLGAAIVDRDALRAAMFPHDDGRDDFRRRATIAAMSELSARLQRGESCIADGRTLARGRDREEVAALAQRHAATFALLWIDCPVEVAAARLGGQHDHPARDRNAGLLREVARRFEHQGLQGRAVLRLDGRLDPDTLAGKALRFLQALSLAPAPSQ